MYASYGLDALTLTYFQLCFHFTGAQGEAGSFTHACGTPVSGRYVTVTMETGSSETLILCEVGVFAAPGKYHDNLENYVKGRPTFIIVALKHGYFGRIGHNHGH